MSSKRKVISLAAFASAAVLASGVGHDLLHMPLQVSDSLAPILDAVRSPSPWHEFRAHVSEVSYFRPMRFATIKIVSDLGNGQYVLAYRLFHALLVFAFLLLFVRALQIHDRLTLAVAPLALTVFLGIHTFLGTVKEITLGEDPNTAGPVRQNFLRDAAQVVTPLEAAVGARRADMVELLLQNGAVMDAAMWTRLMCFAEVVDAGDVRDVLEPRRPASASDQCADVQTPW